MKLLHTADWHLGARLGRHDRARDHREALRELIAIAEAENPDLIVHAGDLFDAFRPPYSALRLGVSALQRLAAIAPTVVIRGNHDSDSLFLVLDELAATATPRRLHFVTRPCVLTTATDAAADSDDPGVRPLRLPDPGPHPVALACVPFIAPGAIADYATGDATRFEGEYADGIRTLNDRVLTNARAAAGPSGVVLYTAHLHVDGARLGTSERKVTVGKEYATHTRGLDRALYCAFGHIHDPQLLPGTARGRYAGSLIPLDFGETGQSKQAVIVAIADDVRVETRPLPPGRPLVDLHCTLEELQERAEEGGLNDSFLRAAVTSDDPLPDLADRVAAWSPECFIHNLVNEVANRRWTPIRAREGDAEDGEPPLDDLFAEWREEGATRKHLQAPLETVLELFREAVAQADEEDGPDFGVSGLVVRAERAMASLRGRQSTAGEAEAD